jgi:hypothetical protein
MAHFTFLTLACKYKGNRPIFNIGRIYFALKAWYCGKNPPRRSKTDGSQNSRFSRRTGSV